MNAIELLTMHLGYGQILEDREGGGLLLTEKECADLYEELTGEEAERAITTQDMRSDLDSGECVIIGHDNSITFCGKPIGQFAEWEEVVQAIKNEIEQTKFSPNVYSVNDHGNVTHLGGDNYDQEVNSWV